MLQFLLFTAFAYFIYWLFKTRHKKSSQNHIPSKEEDAYWIFAERQVGSYPKYTERGGKWLIFVPTEAVDEMWKKIKLAVEQGKLGSMAKVSTAKENPNATSSSRHVICVYTYDATDETDVRKIRSSLRQIGATNKIPYKTNVTTSQDKYVKSGSKNISLYYE